MTVTDAELEALATEILMEANNEKWYEQKARIVRALKLARGTPGLVYTGLGHVPRDFMPGRQSYEEG